MKGNDKRMKKMKRKTERRRGGGGGNDDEKEGEGKRWIEEGGRGIDNSRR